MSCKMFSTRVLLSFLAISAGVSCLKVGMPFKSKVEGQLTLSYKQNEQTIKHQLVFKESTDTETFRSTVSIGYVSYEPKKYYTRHKSSTLTIGEDGSCQTISCTLVPEISWFYDTVLPGKDITKHLKDVPHVIGPTGMLIISLGLLGETELNDVVQSIHRNIPCNIFSKTINLDGGIVFKMEAMVPISGVEFRDLDGNYFSVRGSFSTNQPVTGGISDYTFLIDYYNIESFDKRPQDLVKIEEDFNVPFGRGCSKHLYSYKPTITSKSFSLNMVQWSTSDNILIAYDKSAEFLRREMIGKSTSIWDLNENLLYHVNLNHQAEDTEKMETCSVLQVNDEKLSNTYNPFKTESKVVSALDMIGASEVSYMGKGQVRDINCFIFETTLKQPPIIFALTGDQQGSIGKKVKDYIVTFYILGAKITETAVPILPYDGFWPAQINLYRRFEEDASIEFVDQLNIYDFYWSLDGWNKKSTELFMASECFDDEDEQMRMEMSIVFDEVHKGASSLDDKLLLPYNKYSLEYEMIDQVSKVLGMSKIHITEYELQLRPNHIDLSIVIADRGGTKRMYFYAEGELAEPKQGDTDRLISEGISEENCVMGSSLISEISLAVYCPSDETSKSKCISLIGEQEPVIEKKVGGRNCYSFRFVSSLAPKRALPNAPANIGLLYLTKFTLNAQVPTAVHTTKELTGYVREFDMSHEIPLITIDHYMFTYDPDEDNELQSTSASPKDVRSFDSLTYSSQSDCARICDLDATCASYSYCSNKEDKNQCLLSTLDIRESKVLDQLVHAPPLTEEGKQVAVNGFKSKKYKLTFNNNCAIHERNYLSLYRQTDEIVQVDKSVARQFKTTPTTLECAKLGVSTERNTPGYHVAMFAYCGSSTSCILDESMFEITIDSSSDELSHNQVENEVLCRIYRKKYQTFFNLTASVVKRIPPAKQVELTFNTVEECARACWVKLGQVCASFDYCSPGSCIINEFIPLSEGGNQQVELETRTNCLHYARDLRLDDLKKQYEIGNHQTLDQEEPWTFGSVIITMFISCLTIVAFIYGLALGRQMNDKLESVRIIRQSVGHGLGIRPSQVRGFQSFPNEANLNDEIEEDFVANDFDLGNAIRLDVIKS